jgi:peptide/nickel transport system substrate-binding protein
MLVDQVGINQAYYSGAGYPTCGPVPTQPPNTFADARAKACPNAYDPAKAVSLLTAHGWHVAKGGTSTCERPGTGADQCGAGIAAGAPLKFTLSYPTGGIAYPKTIAQQKSDAAAQAGVQYVLDGEPYSAFAQKIAPCAHASSCTWQIAAAQWTFSPGVYPTGEALFATGANYNLGGYSDPTADKLIAASTSPGDSQQTLDAYQDYIVEQNPVIWQTNTDSLNEVRTSLHGVAPYNVFGYLTPEAWYFAK